MDASLSQAMVCIAGALVAAVVLQGLTSLAVLILLFVWGRPQTTINNTEAYYPYCEHCGKDPSMCEEEDDKEEWQQ